jgi:hypothetical protein
VARPATGGSPVPGAWLDSLAAVMKLSAVEWRIAALVMARGPISVFAIAKVLRLDYTLAKRGARGLAAWNLVRRTPEGLVFQPDSTAWEKGTQTTPIRTPVALRGPSRLPTVPSGPPRSPEDEEEVTLSPPALSDEFTFER